MKDTRLEVPIDHPQVAIDQSPESTFRSVIGFELRARCRQLFFNNVICAVECEMKRQVEKLSVSDSQVFAIISVVNDSSVLSKTSIRSYAVRTNRLR